MRTPSSVLALRRRFSTRPPTALFVAFSRPPIVTPFKFFTGFDFWDLSPVPDAHHNLIFSVDPAWLTHDMTSRDTYDTRVGHPSGSPGTTALTLPAPLDWTRDMENSKHVRGAPARFRYPRLDPSRANQYSTPFLGVLTETLAPDAETATVQPVSAMSYDATRPPEDQAPAAGLMNGVGALAIPRKDLKSLWPKLPDGFNSWRSLVLAAQLAHPSPVTRCDAVLDGERVALFAEDDDSAGAVDDCVFSKAPPSEGDDATAAARLGLVRSAVSLRLRHEDDDAEEVEAAIFVPQSQVRRHRREYDAFSPI